MSLVLVRWHLDASGTNPRETCQRIVERGVKRVFDDSSIIEAVECLYAGKYYGTVDVPDEVRLTLVAKWHLALPTAWSIRSHLKHERINRRIGPRVKDVLCRAHAAWYRRRLLDVTRVALDLHGDAAHPAAVGPLFRAGDDQGMHDYFYEHSPKYQELCSTDATRMAFWQDFRRRGPDGLSSPGHWIENLLLS